MQPPHYTEIINAANRMGLGITFRDGHGFLGQDVYCIKYTVKDKIGMIDDARIAVFPDGVQLLAKNMMHFHRLDGRKKKKFRFEDYWCVEDLTADFLEYILDTVKHYDKSAGMVKQILNKIDQEAFKLLMKSATQKHLPK